MRLRKSRKLGPKPGVSANSCTQQPARFKNDVWTCDFIHDRTAEGGSLKWLTLVDEYTRECLVLHAAGSLTGADVRRIMARVIGRRGAPTRIRSDNGSEFVCDWDRSLIRQRFRSFGVQRSGVLFPGPSTRPFSSLSCSRQHDRLTGGASVLCLVPSAAMR